MKSHIKIVPIAIIGLIAMSIAVFLLSRSAQADDVSPTRHSENAPSIVGSADSTVENVYYVSLQGDNANAGTQSEPWRTIQHAADSVIAGDTVMVMAGAYPEGYVESTASGTAVSPIIFQAEGTVELHGFSLTGDYMQIRGFTIKVFDCAVSDEFGYGIEMRGSNFLIENNSFIETIDAGVYSASTTANGIIRNNSFYHNVGTSIELHGENHLIEGNDIRRPIQDHPVCAVQSDDANGVIYFGSGHILRGNRIYEVWYGEYVRDAHMDCFQTYGGWQTGDPALNSNILIEGNYCEALSYQGADEFGNGVQNEDTGSSDGTLAGGIIIRNNLILAVTCSGAQENSSYLTFVNNTCISDPTVTANSSGLDWWPGTDFANHHYNIHNNIFYNFATFYVNPDVVAGGTVTASHNLIYPSVGNDGGTELFQCNTGDNVCADPLFISAPPADLKLGNYDLQELSPAVDVIDCVNAPAVDINGRLRPQDGNEDSISLCDIGAFERPAYNEELFIPTILNP